MRLSGLIIVAFLSGFLASHGAEASLDLFVLLSSIIFVYSLIGVMELMHAPSRTRRPAREDSTVIQRR
jgi:hypothetical protein